MKIKKALPLICFSMTSLSQADKLTSVTASDFLFEKSDATSPSYNLSYTIASEVDFDNVSGNFSYERIKLNLPLSAPIRINSNTSLLVGFAYEYTNLDLELGSSFEEDLIDTRLNFRWLYKRPGSNWSWSLGLSPGLVTDGNNISSDDFAINYNLGFRYKVSDGFAWTGGVFVSSNSKENKVFPGIGFQWKPTDDTQLDFTGIGLKGYWQPSDNWIVRLNSGFNGGIWNLSQDGRNLDLELESYQVSLGVERHIGGKWWLGAHAGVTLANELELETSAGNEIFSEDAEEGLFTRIELKALIW